jgi:hypothetical protein
MQHTEHYHSSTLLLTRVQKIPYGLDKNASSVFCRWRGHAFGCHSHLAAFVFFFTRLYSSSLQY